jgi:hypothetical protein
MWRGHREDTESLENVHTVWAVVAKLRGRNSEHKLHCSPAAGDS